LTQTVVEPAAGRGVGDWLSAMRLGISRKSKQRKSVARQENRPFPFFGLISPAASSLPYRTVIHGPFTTRPKPHFQLIEHGREVFFERLISYCLAMFKRLLPQETCFFDFFEKHSEITLQAAHDLVSLWEPGCDRAAKIARIAQLEGEADSVTHLCIKALRKTFITPFDRGQIHRLIHHLDDIVDAIDDVGSRLELYEIQEIRPEAQRMSETILQAVVAIGESLKLLRNLKNEDAIKRYSIEIHRLESDCDEILRGAVKRLFKEERDPIAVIKWKEVFDHLELAADGCEDIADIIQGIVLEAS
jgi:uncharacterized protein